MATEKTTDTTAKNPGISREQAADLAALNKSADAEVDPLENPEEASTAAEVDTAALWAEIPELFGSILAMGMPEIQRVYTKDACRKWGEKMDKLAEAKGWDVSAILGPGLGVVVATVPMVVGTVGCIRYYRAKHAAIEAQAKRVEEGTQAPGETAGAVPPEASPVPPQGNSQAPASPL